MSRYRPKTSIPGVNIQWPWSRKIISGEKTVETRSYPLPEKHLNKKLAVIETPGKSGKKLAGITEAQVIGIVVFSKSFRYKDKQEWEQDRKRHCVGSGDPLYQYRPGKAKWGWEISYIKNFKKPQPVPSRKERGIVFATSVPLRNQETR